MEPDVARLSPRNVFDLWDHRGVGKTSQRTENKYAFLLRKKKLPLSERISGGAELAAEVKEDCHSSHCSPGAS